MIVAAWRVGWWGLAFAQPFHTQPDYAAWDSSGPKALEKARNKGLGAVKNAQDWRRMPRQAPCCVLAARAMMLHRNHTCPVNDRTSVPSVLCAEPAGLRVGHGYSVNLPGRLCLRQLLSSSGVGPTPGLERESIRPTIQFSAFQVNVTVDGMACYACEPRRPPACTEAGGMDGCCVRSVHDVFRARTSVAG